MWAWLIKSVAIGDYLNPQPFFPPQTLGWGWKFQPPSHMVGSSDNRPPSSQSHLIAISSGVVKGTYYG